MKTADWLADSDLDRIARRAGPGAPELVARALAEALTAFLAAPRLSERALRAALRAALEEAGVHDADRLDQAEREVETALRGTRWGRIRLVLARELGVTRSELDEADCVRRLGEIGRDGARDAGVHDRRAIEQAAAETPSAVWLSLDGYDHRQPLRPWLRSSRRNQIVTDFRGRGRESIGLVFAGAPSVDPDAPEPDEAPHDPAADRPSRLSGWASQALAHSRALAADLDCASGVDPCAVFAIALRVEVAETAGAAVDQLLPWESWELVRQFSIDAPRVGACWPVLREAIVVGRLTERRQQIERLGERYPDWPINPARWNQWFKRSKDRLIGRIGIEEWDDVFGRLFPT